MVDSIRDFKSNNKNFSLNYKVDTSNFIIVDNNNNSNTENEKEKTLRSFYGKVNKIKLNEENKFDKIL